MVFTRSGKSRPGRAGRGVGGRNWQSQIRKEIFGPLSLSLAEKYSFGGTSNNGLSQSGQKAAVKEGFLQENFLAMIKAV